MESVIAEESGVSSKNASYVKGEDSAAPWLKVVPPDALYVNLLPGADIAEAHFTMTNPSLRSIRWKVSVKSAEIGRTRILGTSPNGGVMKPFQTETVRVVAAVHDLESEHSSQNSVVCKLLIEAVSPKDDRDVDSYCKGDKASVWDFSEDTMLVQPSQEQELVVHVLLPPRKETCDLTPTSSPLKNLNPLFQSTPNFRFDKKPSGVVESIQELINNNELLKKHLEDLEQGHEDNVKALTEAQKEIEESKMKSLVTYRLMKQLEGLKSSKDSLEEEINLVRFQEMERKDQLIESNIRLQGLRLEIERLSQENQLLRQQDAHNSDSIEKLTLRLEDTKSQYEYLKERIESPVTNRGGFRAEYDVSHMKNRNIMLNKSTASARSNMGTGFWKEDMLSGSLPFNTLETSSYARQIPADISQDSPVLDAEKGKKKHTFSCDDESLLFFLKGMTLFFAALTFLAACNILVTDLVK